MPEPLTRARVEQVVKQLQSGSPFVHQGQYLLDHDAAIRAKLAQVTAERETAQAQTAELASQLAFIKADDLSTMRRELAEKDLKIADLEQAVRLQVVPSGYVLLTIGELGRINHRIAELEEG